MKNIIALLTLAVSTCAFGQVAIGKSAVTNTSVSLEFGDYVAGQGKGIVVPWVTSAAAVTGAEKGTIVFDTTDKIMKYKKADGSWFNLSKNETMNVDGTQNVNTTGVVNTTLQDALTDKASAKASIGAPTGKNGQNDHHISV